MIPEQPAVPALRQFRDIQGPAAVVGAMTGSRGLLLSLVVYLRAGSVLLYRLDPL